MNFNTRFEIGIMSFIAYIVLFVGLVHAFIGGVTWWDVVKLRTPGAGAQLMESKALLLGGLAIALLAGILTVLIVVEKNTRRQ